MGPARVKVSVRLTGWQGAGGCRGPQRRGQRLLAARAPAVAEHVELVREPAYDLPQPRPVDEVRHLAGVGAEVVELTYPTGVLDVQVVAGADALGEPQRRRTGRADQEVVALLLVLGHRPRPGLGEDAAGPAAVAVPRDVEQADPVD